VAPASAKRPEELERQLAALAQLPPVKQRQALELEAQQPSRPAEPQDSALQALLLARPQDACALLSPQLPWLPCPPGLRVLWQLPLLLGPKVSCELFPRRPLESSSSGFSFP
jgi:hypothetical protein